MCIINLIYRNYFKQLNSKSAFSDFLLNEKTRYENGDKTKGVGVAKTENRITNVPWSHFLPEDNVQREDDSQGTPR